MFCAVLPCETLEQCGAQVTKGFYFEGDYITVFFPKS